MVFRNFKDQFTFHSYRHNLSLSSQLIHFTLPPNIHTTSTTSTMSNSSHSSLDLMLEQDTSRDLDVSSDHCVSVATTDSLQVKQKQNSDDGKARRSSSKKRMSKRGAPSLDAFVEDCNNSFSALDLVSDMSDLMTVDSRVPNMTGSKTRLTSDRPTRRPVKRAPSAEISSPTRTRRPVRGSHSEDMKASFPVKFERAF
jgi:hypothetical protein